MFTTELIVGTSPNGYSLDLQNEIPISINLSIADIREPEKRNGSYSKTIKLKGTKTNNKFFEHTYQVNVSTNSWNANIKTPAYVLQKGSVVFEGYLRLLQINTTQVNGVNDIEYEVSIFGDNNTLFAGIGDAKLQDLDMSEFDHAYTRQNIINSWVSLIKVSGVDVPFAIGNGYTYPLIDYGYNNFNANSYPVETWRPAIFVREYIDKIFAAAGKTFTSTFFDSDFFKKLIIPHNGDKFTMSAANLALREFLAGDTGASAAQNRALSYGTALGWWHGLASTTVGNHTLDLKFNDDTTNPYTDPSNIYDPTTGIITIQSTGKYSITSKVDWQLKLNYPAGTVSVFNGTHPYHYKLLKSVDGGVTWTIADTQFINDTTPLSSSYANITYTYNYSSTALMYAGEKYKLAVNALVNQTTGDLRFLDGGSNPITTGSASIDARLRSSATLKFTLTNNQFSPGQTITMNDAIPKDIKQRDFLTSLFKAFNLYVDIDANNPDNYLIETRDDFYAAGSTKNWSSKIAWDKPINIKPMAELDWKTLIYRYKADADYYNTDYFNKYEEPYGSYKKVITNDFVQKEVKNELIFSPTTVVNNINNSLIIPYIFAYDGTVVKPVKHNIRLLLYNGLINMSSGDWAFPSPVTDTYGGLTVQVPNCPEAAMVGKGTFAIPIVNPQSEAPLAPTESIEFGVPNEVYYTLGSYYTTNNLFNRFYSRQINEITDRDSKIVTAYVKLDPQDISQFDFRDTIFFEMEDSGAYYYVNKIMDYDPLKDDLTKVEFVKIKTYDAYTATTPLVTQIETNIGNVGMSTNRFGVDPTTTTTLGAGNNVMVGENITSRSSGGLFSGTNISIDKDAERISVVNCKDVTVFNGVSGFSSMNCTGITMGASGHDINLINCSNISIEDFVYGFTGIGLNNETITSRDSNTVRIENVSNIAEKSATKTASFDVNPNISLYYIDCTGGNIVAMFDFSTDVVNKTIKFIRIDASANTFSIDEVSGTATLEGSGVPVNLGMVQWDCFPINNNGVNFFIT